MGGMVSLSRLTTAGYLIDHLTTTSGKPVYDSTSRYRHRGEVELDGTLP